MGFHYQRSPYISLIVKQVFAEHDVAILAHELGILNLTAFARLILPQIEQRAKQPVKLKTVAAILSRCTRTCLSHPSFTHQEGLRLDSLQVKIQQLKETRLKQGLVQLKTKFQVQNCYNPARFYAILARLATTQVTLHRLVINNSQLEMVVADEDAAAVALALRKFMSA